MAVFSLQSITGIYCTVVLANSIYFVDYINIWLYLSW